MTGTNALHGKGLIDITLVGCSYPAAHAPHHHPHPSGPKLVCHVCHPPAGVEPVSPAAVSRALVAASQRARVQLWTDGASSKDGRGGWAFILVALDNGGQVMKRIEDSGGALGTTNNRMELLAVIRGLEALTRPSTVTVFSDSAYVVNAFLQDWIGAWERNGWTRKVRGQGRQPVANQDLWRELIALNAKHVVEWTHVRGHAGHALNEQCDQLAGAAKERMREHLQEAVA